MKESQAEIRAIQAKLQALQMGRSTLPQTSEPPTEPVSPPAQPTATMGKARSETIDSPDPEMPAVGETLQQRWMSSLSKHHLSESSAPPAEVSRKRPEEIAAGRRQSARPPAAVLHPKPPTPPSMSNWALPHAEAVQRLEAQADRINRLSLDQEAALLELKTIAEQIDRNRKSEDDGLEEPTWEYLSAAVPLVERDETGMFVVTTRSVDLYQAERDAVLMAQSLRSRTVAPGYRVSRPARRPAAKPALQTAIEAGEGWGKVIGQKIQDLLPARRPARLRRQPDPTPLTVQDAALWIIGAIVARRGLDLLLAAFPQFWLPVVALIVTPAAIAIYRTTFTPESGFAWGYRLFLVMIGLLIGGRL